VLFAELKKYAVYVMFGHGRYWHFEIAELLSRMELPRPSYFLHVVFLAPPTAGSSGRVRRKSSTMVKSLKQCWK
jgi:hypothetical protein